MKYFITFIVFLINFIFQTTLLRGFQIFGVIPNTTLVLVVLYSLLFKERYGIIFGIIFGLIHDIFYGPIIGLSALLYFMIGFIVSEIKKSVYKDTVFSSLVLVVLSVAVFNIGYLIFVNMFGIKTSFLQLFPEVIIELLYDLVITFIVYKIFVRVYSRLRNKGFR